MSLSALDYVRPMLDETEYLLGQSKGLTSDTPKPSLTIAGKRVY